MASNDMYGDYVAVCKNCNSPMINGIAGAICPNGCGPIYKHLNLDDAMTGARALVAKATAINDKHFVGDPVYELEGKEGKWLKVGVVKATSGSLPVIPPQRQFGRYVCENGSEIICIFERVRIITYTQTTFSKDLE